MDQSRCGPYELESPVLIASEGIQFRYRGCVETSVLMTVLSHSRRALVALG